MGTYLLEVIATGSMSGAVVALGVLGTCALPWTAAEVDDVLASSAWLLDQSRAAWQRAPEAVAGWMDGLVSTRAASLVGGELVPRRW
jgi:hypothetical protein